MTEEGGGLPAGVEDRISGRGSERAVLGALLTAAGLAVVAVLVVGAAILVSDSRWDEARVRASARAEQAAVQIGGLVASAVAEVEALSRAGSSEPVPPHGLASVVPVGADGVPGSDEPGLDGVVDDPAVRVALARARDSGGLVLSAPTATDPPVSVLVRATYRGDGGESAAARRTQLDGYVLGVLDTAALLPRDEPGALWLSDGGTVLVGPVDDDHEAVTAVVPVLDRRWEVASPVRPPSTAPLWGIAAAGLLATLLLASAASIWRTSFERTRSRAADSREQAAAVLTYAGVVQESHELGEVVPALAVELTDRLGLAGVSFSVAAGGRLREIFVHGDPPDRSAAPRTAVPRSAETGETVALHLRRAERSIGVLRVRCGRPLGPNEFDQVRIAGELVTSTVVTSRSLEQQQDAVDRLRTLDELKTAFLGTASHELRTPVTAISGFSTMLSDRWVTLSEENRRMFADRIASNARVLDSLVQDLLDFARLERGDLSLVLESVDLAVVTDRVLDRLTPVWESHRVARSIDPGAIVWGDVAALERVVTNLLSNAVKFSPAGTTVVVRVEAGDRVRLVVEDEGPGVPAGERDRIFVRFFRGEGDAVMRTTGVGIGLSVVQDYIARMGGRIEVESTASGGARFVIELERPDPSRQAQEEGTDVTA